MLKNLNEKQATNHQFQFHLDSNKENINSNRKSWSKETDLSQLENKTLLAETGQKTTYTNKKYTRPIISPRKAWDLPHQTIIKCFELAEISPPSSTNMDKNLKGSETFVIDKKSTTSSSSSASSNLLVNEKEPSFFEKMDALESTNKTHVDLVFSPEKLATLKATKNLLLGVTLGQFDQKNTKVKNNISSGKFKPLK